METEHKIFYQSSEKLDMCKDNTVHLVVTSPPYPMIEMWDGVFSAQNENIKKALQNNNGNEAFELMHQELDKVWKELYRVLIPGGIVCVNIGDATRTINKVFQLFPSHSRIIESFRKIGFQSLPEILWRKQTNAPNKFMGSGMLPPGAYVTLEHEYILLFRKGDKREFEKEGDKQNRQGSAYFWEERNIWFSDVWDFKGISQCLIKNGARENSSKENGTRENGKRERSAAFPFELAYRLINMFSVNGDTVLDPFLGTGTTIIASIASERNSIGIEISPEFKELIEHNLMDIIPNINEYINKRIDNHIQYINQRISEKGATKYINDYYNFPVMTNQELTLRLSLIERIKKRDGNGFIVKYKEMVKK